MSTTFPLANADRRASGDAPSAAIEFEHVGKRFGDTWVLQDLSFVVPRGTILGLIGPSGCGKTTTIRLATGAYVPDEGLVQLLGSPPHLGDGGRHAIGYLPQEPVLFDELSLWENLNFHASLNGVPFRRRRLLQSVLELVELDGHERKLVRNASGGMKRRLALAATLVHGAPIVVLDEPTAGIDPVLRMRFWDHFRALRDEGHTVIVATQYVGEAADCDQVLLLNEGRVAGQGTPEELRRLAFGGDIVEVETADPIGEADVQRLRSIDAVFDVEPVHFRRARLVVADGGAALPAVIEALQRRDHEIVDSEEILPSYDEVFVQLVTDGPPSEPTSTNRRPTP